MIYYPECPLKGDDEDMKFGESEKELNKLYENEVMMGRRKME